MPSADRYARYRADQTTIWVSKRAAEYLARERAATGEATAAALDRLLGELRSLRKGSGGGAGGAAKSARGGAKSASKAASKSGASGAKSASKGGAKSATRGSRSAAKAGGRTGARTRGAA
jgi:hypothetical protein